MNPNNVQQIHLLRQRHVAAAYLNMARHNAFITLNAISQQLGKNLHENEANLDNASVLSTLNESQSRSKPDVAQRAIRLFSKSFAFLIPIEDEFISKSYWDRQRAHQERGTAKMAKMEKAVPNDIHEILRLILGALNKLRNGFTHYEKSDEQTPEIVKNFNPNLMHCLKILFDDAKRSAKKRMNFTETDLNFLDRMKSQGRKKYVENPDFKFKFDDKNGHLTEAGLLFFTCMFLEGKYASEFISQYSLCKQLPESQKIIFFQVFTQYRIRIPNLRIDSEKNDNLLYLDILGELQRCPQPLYEHISLEDKAQFKVVPDPEEAQTESDETDEGVTPQPILKRHGERFEYMAMRYIDEIGAFDQLRFMVDLGNYHFAVYDKPIIGETRVRRLTQKLLGFGRLQDFSTESIAAQYGELVLDPANVSEDYDKPYIVKTTPHYNLYDDNIAIRWGRGASTTYPDIKRNLKKYDRPSREQLRPDYYISKFELPTLAAICALGGGAKIEQNIRSYEKNLVKFFEDLKSGKIAPVFNDQIKKPEQHATQSPNDQSIATVRNRAATVNEWLKQKGYDGIVVEELPKDVKDYLLGLLPRKADTIAIERLRRLIVQTRLRIARIKEDIDPKNKNNKIGSKKERLVLAGHLGIFLAEDMMFFQPHDHTGQVRAGGKATGLIFQVLEAALSQFAVRKDEIKQLFLDCNLWPQSGKNNHHPFLEKIDVDTSRNVVDYYLKYLDARLKYLQGVEQGETHNEVHWLRSNKAVRRETAPDFIQQLAASYRNNPINLPKGLFTPLLEQMLEQQQSGFGEHIKQNAKDGRANPSYLLQQYHHYVLKDNSQPFYEMKRCYKVIDQYEARSQRQRAKVNEVYFDTERLIEKREEAKAWAMEQEDPMNLSKLAALRALDKNERFIRKCKTQDIVLFMMVKDLIRRNNDIIALKEKIDWMKLSDISPLSEQSILSQFVPYELNLLCELTDDAGNKTGVTLEKTIYQNEIKIKNIGDFRRFVKDRRLGNLLAHFDEKRLARKIVEDELDIYDRMRIGIFEHILKFEAAMMKAFPDIDLSDKEKMHNTLLNKCFDYFGDVEDLKVKMKAIRNAFAHNQFPNPQFMPEGNTQMRYAKYYADWVVNTYGEFTKKLNKIK